MHKSIIKTKIFKAIVKLMVLAASRTTWKVSLPLLQHEKLEQTENKCLFLSSLRIMVVGQTPFPKLERKANHENDICIYDNIYQRTSRKISPYLFYDLSPGFLSES